MYERCQIGKVLQAHGLLLQGGVTIQPICPQGIVYINSHRELMYISLFSLTATGNPISKNASLKML